MKKKIKHKTYGEGKLKIPSGWYTETEIEKMLETVRTQDKVGKEILEKSIETFNEGFNSRMIA